MDKESPLTWPKKLDDERINRYAHNDRLYAGDHFNAFSIKVEKDFSRRYAELRYIVANFGGLMSRIMADMLFGENIVIDVKDNDTQQFVAELVEENDLMSQSWESAVCNSRRGDDCFKLRIGKRHPADAENTVIIEQFTPAIYFPVLESNMTRNTPRQEVIADVFRRDNKTYLHKEIHEPGRIYNEVYSYSADQKRILGSMDPIEFGYDPVVDTKVKRSLLFHIPNVRDGSGYFGTSDYQGLEPLFFALNNRITKTDNILDKHSDPILAVPPGVLDEDGKINKEALGMFEVDNETPGFNKPEYIVWNANLEAAEKELDKLIEMLYMFSEVSPGTMGLDKGGVAESGRALKFKMIATIRKRNRKMRYYDMVMKYLVLTAQELAIAHGAKVGGLLPKSPEKPTIKWNDRIISDEVEAVDIATARIDNGTMSRADAVAELDGVSPDEAKVKVKEIDDEAGPVMIPANNVNGNGTGGAGKQPANPGV